MKRAALDDPRYYFNRHVQWLEFNRRVLEEGRDIGNPLLERVKFLAITKQIWTSSWKCAFRAFCSTSSTVRGTPGRTG